MNKRDAQSRRLRIQGVSDEALLKHAGKVARRFRPVETQQFALALFIAGYQFAMAKAKIVREK